MASHPEAMKFSSWRPPAWRWERALRLVDARRHHSRKRDDRWTGEAMRYVRLQRRHPDAGRDGLLSRRFPAIHGARLLHEQGGKSLEVQARLLARQGVEGAAHAAGLPADTVTAYEAVFYNVTGSLDARDWIVSHAIGWWRFDPLKGRDATTVLKGHAYHGGVHVLEAMLPYVVGGRLAEPALDASTPEGRLDRSVRLVLELDMLPWTEESSRLLLRSHLELLESATKRPLDREDAGRTGRLVDGMLGETPIGVDKRDAGAPSVGANTPLDLPRRLTG